MTTGRQPTVEAVTKLAVGSGGSVAKTAGGPLNADCGGASAANHRNRNDRRVSAGRTELRTRDLLMGPIISIFTIDCIYFVKRLIATSHAPLQGESNPQSPSGETPAIRDSNQVRLLWHSCAWPEAPPARRFDGPSGLTGL